jgi:ferric-dicitrate binding protein FerR (iron transport regulator)
MAFDDTARSYARFRDYDLRHDNRRACHRHCERRDENNKALDQISGATSHQAEPDLQLSLKS